MRNRLQIEKENSQTNPQMDGHALAPLVAMLGLGAFGGVPEMKNYVKNPQMDAR